MADNVLNQTLGDAADIVGTMKDSKGGGMF